MFKGGLIVAPYVSSNLKRHVYLVSLNLTLMPHLTILWISWKTFVRLVYAEKVIINVWLHTPVYTIPKLCHFQTGIDSLSMFYSLKCCQFPFENDIASQ